MIGDDIRIVFLRFKGSDGIKLGITAPRGIVVDRLEVYRQKKLDEEVRGIQG